MLSELNHKVILVTGGTRSIGRALVMSALQQNAYVVFCARNLQAGADEIFAAAKALGKLENVRGIAADISNEDEVVNLFDSVMQQFGRLDIVINNAAVTWDALLVSLPKKGWDQLFKVNLTGSFLVTREALKIFMKQNIQGKIMSIGSLAQSGAPSNAGYAASKGGLVGLMQTVAKDYARYGISANTIALGLVDTEMTRNYPAFAKRVLIEACPQKRSSTPAEIANIILGFVAKDLRCINGQTIFASGGLTDFPLDFPN